MEYQVVSPNEWLYPDSEVSETGSREISLSAARGTRAACQILFQGVARDVPISCKYRPDAKISKSPWQRPEIYQLLDVAVEKNTGPRGFVVKEGESGLRRLTHGVGGIDTDQMPGFFPPRPFTAGR